MAEKVPPDILTVADLHRGRGLAYETLWDFERARADHETNLQIARAAGEHQVEWRTQLDLGKLWAYRDYNQPRDYFEAALELARRIGEPAFLAVSLNWMGNRCANDENPKRASE